MPAAENDLTELYIRSFKCTGDVPPALVGSSLTYLEGNAYVFGGRALHTGKLSNDIYICDLKSHQWRRINTSQKQQLNSGAMADSQTNTSAQQQQQQQKQQQQQQEEATSNSQPVSPLAMPTSVPPAPRFFHSATAFKHYMIVYGGMGLDVDNDAATPSGPPGVSSALQDDRNQQSFQIRANKTLLGDLAVFDTRMECWVAQRILDTSAHSAADSGEDAGLKPLPRYAHLATLFGSRLLIVGGQDLEEQYVEELNVFDLQVGRWVMRSPFPRAVGLYRSFIANVPATNATLLYSNYSFASVKRALYSLSAPPDCTLKEVSESLSGEPPGLRFPRGHLVDPQTVVMTGTLISTEGHSELSVWSLDTKAMRWQPVSCGAKFRAGSWNQSLVDPRTNTLMLFGDSRRDLMYDYQRRRLNYSEIRAIDLRALGYLRTKPVEVPDPKTASSHGFMAAYRAAVTRAASQSPLAIQPIGPNKTAAELSYEMGSQFLFYTQFSDAEVIGVDGRRVAGANSGILRARWPVQAQMWLAGDNLASENFAKAMLAVKQDAVANSQPYSPVSNSNSSNSNSNSNRRKTSGSDQKNARRPESSLLSGDYETASSDDALSVRETTGPRRYFIEASREAIYVLLFYLYTDRIDPAARLGPQQSSADAGVLADESSTVRVLGEVLGAALKYNLHRLALRTVNLLRFKVSETMAPIIYEAALRAGHLGLQSRCVIAVKDVIGSLRMDRKSSLYMISNASRASLIRFFPKLNVEEGAATGGSSGSGASYGYGHSTTAAGGGDIHNNSNNGGRMPQNAGHPVGGNSLYHQQQYGGSAADGVGKHYTDASRQRSASDLFATNNGASPQPQQQQPGGSYMLPSPSASPASTVLSGQARSPYSQQDQQQQQLSTPRRPWETTAAMMSSPVINSPASSRFSSQSPDVRSIGGGNSGIDGANINGGNGVNSKRLSTNISSSFAHQPLSEDAEVGYSHQQHQYEVSTPDQQQHHHQQQHQQQQQQHSSNRVSRYFGSGGSVESVVAERRPSDSSSSTADIHQQLQQLQQQQQQPSSSRSRIFRPWAKMKKIASNSQVSTTDVPPPVPSHASSYSTNSAN
ncbi:hypothetical protein IW140_005613 [Coemansia sp. RSA 1813]|nr:hypothetical protein IW138_005666 [Coemansia sp. RSA 986]KAJ2215026.1 hypothetical protein EV179_002556 [Coemansia sp. RSA 487]KAJ2564774.1 hypothetical protein IW140_005613 [Coemansia sp. RSA 1813]